MYGANRRRAKSTMLLELLPSAACSKSERRSPNAPQSIGHMIDGPLTLK
jgi:hypothetical protein